MKKGFILLLIINLYSVAYNQVIRGTVTDQLTEDTIDFASVFFSGTFVGTISDQHGNFELDVAEYANSPLTISAIGYYSTTLTNFSTGGPFLIALKPKSYDIEEISVRSKSLVRKRKANLKVFKNEFLGRSKNGKYCQIINEEDIRFNYYSDKDTLRAFTLKPLLIHNNSLGYVVTCYLDRFEYDKKKRITFFEGEILFNEDLISDSARKNDYEINRTDAYNGSCMHFFRSLWADSLGYTDFIIKDYEHFKLKYKHVVFEGQNNQKFLIYTEDLHIKYKDERSTITFLKDRVLFEENGFFDAAGILWQGALSQERLGDWLPYEYSISE